MLNCGVQNISFLASIWVIFFKHLLFILNLELNFIFIFFKNRLIVCLECTKIGKYWYYAHAPYRSSNLYKNIKLVLFSITFVTFFFKSTFNLVHINISLFIRFKAICTAWTKRLIWLKFSSTATNKRAKKKQKKLSYSIFTFWQIFIHDNILCIIRYIFLKIIIERYAMYHLMVSPWTIYR